MKKTGTAKRNLERNAKIVALKAAGVSVRDLSLIFDLCAMQIYRITNKRNLEQ